MREAALVADGDPVGQIGNVYLGNVQIKGVVFVNQAVFKLVKQLAGAGNFGAHCLKPFPVRLVDAVEHGFKLAKQNLQWRAQFVRKADD